MSCVFFSFSSWECCIIWDIIGHIYFSGLSGGGNSRQHNHSRRGTNPLHSNEGAYPTSMHSARDRGGRFDMTNAREALFIPARDLGRSILFLWLLMLWLWLLFVIINITTIVIAVVTLLLLLLTFASSSLPLFDSAPSSYSFSLCPNPDPNLKSHLDLSFSLQTCCS